MSPDAAPSDIAILGSRWFAIDPTPALVELTPMTNQVIHSFPAPSANSLGGSHLMRSSPNGRQCSDDNANRQFGACVSLTLPAPSHVECPKFL